MTTIYLAGPDVFLPDAVEVGRRKAQFCASHGLIGLYPLDNSIDPAASRASLQIYRANRAMMDQADAIIANLTPFRGPGADAGTVFELGYMAGHGKPCFGYTNDVSLYVERVGAFTAIAASDGCLRDSDDSLVEDFGLADNLMMVHALDLPLVTPTFQPDDVWHDFATFEICLRQAMNYLSQIARAAAQP